MIRINLLPVRAAQKKEKLISQIVILVFAIVVVGLGCFGMQRLLSSKIENVKREIASTQNEIATLNKKIGEVNKIKKLTEELDSKKKVLESLEAARSGPVRTLDELSNVIPDSVWIDSFQLASGVITLRGKGTTEEVVAVFLRDLEASPYFQGVELGSVKRSDQGNDFDLTCRVETPPAN